MGFEFQLLSLLMIFLLVITYYTKKTSFTKGNKIFRSILLITYILQLCSLAIYIGVKSGNSTPIIFGKFYLLGTTLWFALISLYYISILLKEKYKQNESKLKILWKKILTYFIIIQFISAIVTLISPINFTNSFIDYHNHFSIYLIGIYLIIELLALLSGYKKIEKNKYFHLLIIFIIEITTFFLQGRSPELPLYHIGIIFTVFYNYLFLENIEKEELKTVTLERDYARNQSIDKSNFLKNLSHQIRTPLNTIDGFSQIILESDDVEEIKTDIKDIRSASKDLIDVINGMIELSIIESGNLELINENYNIYDLLDEIINITNSKLENKNIKFITKIDKNIPEVLYGDAERISQIILNLLKNAIKFTEKGTITLEVTSVKSNSICRLKFNVIDTGRGIKKEELNSIFEEKDGKRLGLVVSKYLADLMEGTIDVESTYGAGSIFTLTINQKIINEKQEKQLKKSKEIIQFQAKDKRILLVDDNKLNLKVASRLLEPYKVEVVEATSGQECLNILEHDNSFDLILMDDLMPEMSGTECLDIIKKIERIDGYYIPVVVLTANAVSGMKEKYLNNGFEDYLAKPIDKYELHKILKKYLKGRK